MKKFLIITVTVLVLLSVCSCGGNKGTVLTEDGIKSIKELATYKCYYNNVATIIKEPDHMFQKQREIWIEYVGYATLGIDMSKVNVDIQQNGTVKIQIPKASLLTTNVDENSFKYYISADGWFWPNRIDIETQQEGYAKAQEEMKQVAANNTYLLDKAETRAKNIIANYVEKIGNISSIEYNIVWEMIK